MEWVHVILFLHTYLKGNGNTLLTNLFQGKWYSFSCTHFSREIANFLHTICLFHTCFRGNGNTFHAHLFQKEMVVQFLHTFKGNLFQRNGDAFFAHLFQRKW